MFLICIWLLMAFSLTSYYASEEHSHQVPLSEVIIPVISLVGLSVLHCVISQTKPLECKTTSRQKTSHAARRTTRSKTLRRFENFENLPIIFSDAQSFPTLVHSPVCVKCTQNILKLHHPIQLRSTRQIQNRQIAPKIAEKDDRERKIFI